jgi:hypothetical protein
MTHWDDDSMEVPEMEQNYRRGGAQVEGETETAVAPASTDEEAKRQALAAKKAEVRKRLEEAGKKGKKKKGFLTPERKKKLRKLLMIKAAENLKNQQAKQDSERQSALSSRVPAAPNVDTVEDKGQLEKIYNDLFQKLLKLEEEKYDIQFEVSQKDSEINEMSISVNDLRGKFVKPTLKKVSKYENRFRKTTDGEAKPKEDFRAKLKTVEKKNVMEVLETKQKMKSDKPEWTKKGEEKVGARRSSAASSKGGTEEAAPAPAAKKEPEPEPEPAEAPAEEEEEEEEVGEEEEEE